MLKGKNIVVGVSGGIVVYKAVEVVSRLIRMEAEVNVIMTANAAKFVTPLTFQTISRNMVACDMFEEPKAWEIRHISLAEKADLVLVAPATANIIGKIAGGIADDMLSTTIMATKAPVLFVPAMNCNMYENAIVQQNIEKLGKLGYRFLEPDSGLLACGAEGKGRLPEPRAIAEAAAKLLTRKKDMEGLRLLVTAGPTREPIDPVRYISNHSSGKMGFAIAAEAAERGARVTVVSGPVSVAKPENVEVVDIGSTQEMYEKMLALHGDSDVVIFAAAPADYRCRHISDIKIKKKEDTLSLELIKNPDVAKELGARKGGRIHIGFSAETNDLAENAEIKLKAKNFDMIVANDVTMEGAGFGTDTNIVRFLKPDGSVRQLPIMSKKDVAREILDEVMKIHDGRIQKWL